MIRWARAVLLPAAMLCTGALSQAQVASTVPCVEPVPPAASGASAPLPPPRLRSLHYRCLTLAEGQRVRAGTPIAYVGDTGNAENGDHHLHFGIARMGIAERWWQGTPINPYPVIAGAQARR